MPLTYRADMKLLVRNLLTEPGVWKTGEIPRRRISGTSHSHRGKPQPHIIRCPIPIRIAQRRL
jgi:hypothetical protein